MDASDIEENLKSIGEPKLHGEMCNSLCAVYVKVLMIFPGVEAARPRSTSGIQALCALHIALEKTKNILRHCAECSKFYLAATGDSVVLKFEKARFALEDALNRVEDIVPQAISCQISEISSELRRIEFSLDPTEKEIGDEVIALIQQGLNINGSSSENNRLESFHQAASKLGITSSRAAVRERRSLRKLIERSRAEEDKRKEVIISYLLHLMKKYSKLFRIEFSDDNDSQGSTPCSPTIPGYLEDGGNLPGRISFGFDRQLSKPSSFNFKTNFCRSEQMIATPPEELRCPISLQLMYDPVIISSGQTYERVCIEKWFGDGHYTCPKSQQQLTNLSLTPNYCVKGLVASWCERNGVPVPYGPPESLDLNYWRLVLSEAESANSRSSESIDSCKFKGGKVIPFCDNTIIEEAEGNEDDCEVRVFERYEDYLSTLHKEDDLVKKCEVVEKIRLLLKDDEETRMFMGANGFVEALLQFLESAVSARNGKAQEIGALALFNLALNNNRNKELMLASGVISTLQRMIANPDSVGPATVLYLNLSSLEAAKPIIGTSSAIPISIHVLNHHETDQQCKSDALHTLYNISSYPTNTPHLISAGIIPTLASLITNPSDHSRTEKCISVLIHLSSSNPARDQIANSPGIITALASILDAGGPLEQEQAAACLLVLCNADEKCSQTVLQEGVIPSLVSISVNGTARGKQKAQRLLMLFREQRQRDPSTEASRTTPSPIGQDDVKVPLSKSTSRRKVGKAFGFWRRNKSFSVYQC